MIMCHRLSLDLNASGTIEEAQRHFVGLLNATEKVACNTPKSDIVKQINARQAKDQLQVRRRTFFFTSIFFLLKSSVALGVTMTSRRCVVLQERFSNNLLSFLECMQGIMREEKLLIQSCEPSVSNTVTCEHSVCKTCRLRGVGSL